MVRGWQESGLCPGRRRPRRRISQSAQQPERSARAIGMDRVGRKATAAVAGRRPRAENLAAKPARGLSQEGADLVGGVGWKRKAPRTVSCPRSVQFVMLVSRWLKAGIRE